MNLYSVLANFFFLIFNKRITNNLLNVKILIETGVDSLVILKIVISSV